jgi:hypothetical protein
MKKSECEAGHWRSLFVVAKAILQLWDHFKPRGLHLPAPTTYMISAGTAKFRRLDESACALPWNESITKPKLQVKMEGKRITFFINLALRKRKETPGTPLLWLLCSHHPPNALRSLPEAPSLPLLSWVPTTSLPPWSTLHIKTGLEDRLDADIQDVATAHFLSWASHLSLGLALLPTTHVHPVTPLCSQILKWKLLSSLKLHHFLLI